MQDKQTKINEVLATNFPGDKVEVIDYAGDQDHFTLKIYSPKFNGLKTIDKQRMVFKALGPLATEIHAFQFELFAV